MYVYMMYCCSCLEGEKQQSSGASASATGGADDLDPVDPFLALMNEESKRLQSMHGEPHCTLK